MYVAHAGNRHAGMCVVAVCGIYRYMCYIESALQLQVA